MRLLLLEIALNISIDVDNVTDWEKDKKIQFFSLEWAYLLGLRQFYWSVYSVNFRILNTNFSDTIHKTSLVLQNSISLILTRNRTHNLRNHKICSQLFCGFLLNIIVFHSVSILCIFWIRMIVLLPLTAWFSTMFSHWFHWSMYSIFTYWSSPFEMSRST